MSEREQAKQMIEIEDDLYCEKLVEDYQNDPDPEKHETITIEELAKREGITL